MTLVDVRCPVNPRRLFMRLRHDPDVRIDPGTNLIQVVCRDCGRQSGRTARVTHHYNILGELVDTTAREHV